MPTDLPTDLPTALPDDLPHEAVLFDCDGVLADSEATTNEVLRGMLAEMGWALDARESLHRFVGRAVMDQADVIEEHTGVRIDAAWLTGFRARRDAALRAGLRPVAGAPELVAAVAARYGDRVACASGADRAKTEMQLDVTGLRRHFGDRVFSGQETPRTKPAPDVYLLAAATLGVDPARAAVVEDSVAGVTAGAAAGAVVYAYCAPDQEHTAPAALRVAGAAVVVSDLAELVPLLTGP